MRNLIIILVLLMTSVGVFAQTINSNTAPQTAPQQTNYTRPDKKERFNKYVKGIFGLSSLIGPLASVTLRQITNSPEEWGRTPRGFAKRVGDSFGRSIISHTITYGLDEALKLDSHYYKSTKKGFKPKFSNAVLSAFTARNSEGKRVVGIPRLVGTYSSAIIANETWMPGDRNYKDGLKSGTISIGTRIGYNLLREFVFK